MGKSKIAVRGLTTAGCCARQRRLVAELQTLEIDAVLITDRRHVYYFSGFWSATHHAPAMLIAADGMVQIVLPEDAQAPPLAADVVHYYQAQKQGTLIEDQQGASLRELGKSLQAVGRLGFDLPSIPDRKSVV